MTTGLALFILVVLMGFVIGYQVFCGTDRIRRFVACGLKLGLAYVMYFVAVPRQPETDVGRFAEAIGRQTEQRIAAKYEEMSRGVFATADRR